MTRDSGRPDEAREAAREYLDLARRQKWLILLSVLVVAGVAVALSVRQEKRYRATAEVLLTHQDLATGLLRLPDPNAAVDPDRLAATQATVARTPLVAERTLRAAHVRDRTALAFLAQSKVAPQRDVDVLAFSVEDPDPKLAIKLATEYARQYPQYRLELERHAIARATVEVRRQLAALRGTRRTDSGLYKSLVEKLGELGTLQALETTSAVLSRQADEAAQIQPRPLRKGMVGLVIGALLGIAAALLRDALDTKVRTVEEIEERLGIPLVGRLAQPTGRSEEGGPVMALTEPNGRRAEAFRMVRSNLEFANLDRGARSVMVTSCVESEGKSSTIANLGVVMAHAGKRVIVVDLDLRRPAVHAFLDTPAFPGITDVALGHVTLESALVPVALGPPGADAGGIDCQDDERSLEVLAGGTQPPSIGEFMSARAVGSILEDLRERADVVLVDAPPLLRVGDAIALSARVDAILLITRLNVVTRPMLADVSRLLERSSAHVMGVIATGAEPKDGYGHWYVDRARAARRAVRVGAH